MKTLVGFIVLLSTTSVLAQSPPKAAKRPPPVQLKPQAPMGCKLAGTARGTKILHCRGACSGNPTGSTAITGYAARREVVTGGADV